LGEDENIFISSENFQLKNKEKVNKLT